MPSYDSFLGAVFVGLLIETVLFGVACIQTFFYYRHSRSDRMLFKIIVAVITVCNFVQLSALASMLYGWLVESFGDINATHKPAKQAIVEVTFSCLNDFIVRSFFARRVYILWGLKRKHLGLILACVVATVSLAVFILTSTHAIKMYQINSQPASPARTADQLKLSWLLYTFYSLGASADLTIAIFLSLSLARNRTGFKRTDNLVMFWVLFSLNTGLLTSIFAITALLLYLTRPSTLYSLAISYVLTQLHVNSLLVSLNARGALRNRTVFDPSTEGTVGNLAEFTTGDLRDTQMSGMNITTSYALPYTETKLTITKEVATYDDATKPADL